MTQCIYIFSLDENTLVALVTTMTPIHLLTLITVIALTALTLHKSYITTPTRPKTWSDGQEGNPNVSPIRDRNAYDCRFGPEVVPTSTYNPCQSNNPLLILHLGFEPTLGTLTTLTTPPTTIMAILLKTAHLM